MHAISYKRLREFSDDHPEALEPLKAWYKTASRSSWKNLSDVRHVYPHADAVGKCTVFNVMGNEFRLVAQIVYEVQIVYIRKVMTHAEYSIKNGARWKKSCGC